MKSRESVGWWVVLILGVMALLMASPIAEDSATIDEPVFLGAGYSYWHGQRYYFNAEHPPLAQLWTTLPLLWLDPKIPAGNEHYFDRPSPLHTFTTWNATVRPREEFSQTPPAFYLYPHLEAGYFGQALLYRGVNDADRLLTACRWFTAILTILTGLVIFLWARSLGNTTAGLIALITWAFNPLALGYGHLIVTDAPFALTALLAVWTWTRFVEKPDLSRMALSGLCLSLALLTKYTAVLLGPIFIVLAVMAWITKRPPARPFFLGIAGILVIAWLGILAVYLPHLSPPPPIDSVLADQLGVPGWFRTFRLFLIPRDYFRGLALMLTHAQGGHDSYLLGQWSSTGWWYYYPLAIFWKTPLPLLFLIFIAATSTLQSRIGLIPLLAALIFLGLAMFNHANIGIRHILPIFPLLSVFIGAQLGAAPRIFPRTTNIFCGLLVLVVFGSRLSYVSHFDYFNEFADRPANNSHYLIDSNLDWGQDVKRLKAYVDKNQIEKIYGSYFGPGGALAYYRIPFTGMTAAQLKEQHGVWAAVSVNWLMQPDYDWLRENLMPYARVGNSILIYRLP